MRLTNEMRKRVVQSFYTQFQESLPPSNSAGYTLQGPRRTITELAKLPFWCWNNDLHVKYPEAYHEQMCCWNHAVGLPVNPMTNEEMPLTPYQLEYFTGLWNERHPPHPADYTPDQLKAKLYGAHKQIDNKARQIGYTEIVLRGDAYQCMHDYAGRKCGIMAGTKGDLARKNLGRMRDILKRHWPDFVESDNRAIMPLITGSTVEAFSTHEESMTGDTKYKSVFLDEMAKWKNQDDWPVINSVEPIVDSNGADLKLVSTPKGRVKAFYGIWKDPGEYRRIEHDIWRALGNLYTKQQIEHKLATSKADPGQEYLCQFVMQSDAILGEVDDSMRYTADTAETGEWFASPEDEDFVE